MILLDTNILILGLVANSAESERLAQWHAEGIPLLTSAIVWYEFQCGPVRNEHLDLMRRLLSRVLPFTEREASLAAELFVQAGRKRGMKVDAMIAATAIANGAKLATNNQKDFQSFPGLELLW